MKRAFSECIGVDDSGRFQIEDRLAIDLADEFGTPLYVISEEQIRQNVRAITRVFRTRYPRTEILFSNKANNNPAVRRIFNQEGAGGDCFGYGELYLSLLAGTDPNRLMLNGSNKQPPEITLAIESGVTINLDSVEEAEQVADIARQVGRRPAKVNPRTRLMLNDLDEVEADWPRGIPVGPGARGHKFGMHYEDVLETCRQALASEWLDLVGLHHHVGRWTNDLELHRAVVREQVAWTARLPLTMTVAGRGCALNVAAFVSPYAPVSRNATTSPRRSCGMQRAAPITSNVHSGPTRSTSLTSDGSGSALAAATEW